MSDKALTLVPQILAAHQEAVSTGKKSLEAAIKCGELLLKAKEAVKHGDWSDWLAKSTFVPEEDRARYLKPNFLKLLEPLEPVRFLPELKSRRLRIQFVDEYGEPKEAVRKIELASPSAATLRHYSTALELRNVTADGGLFKWITSELMPAQETVQKIDTESKKP